FNESLASEWEQTRKGNMADERDWRKSRILQSGSELKNRKLCGDARLRTMGTS
ncbi:hypothetical protein BgiMline_033338, partial [Biomphalaria glabrata]